MKEKYRTPAEMESLPPVVILSEAKNLRTDSPAKGVAFAKILRCAQDDTFFGFCGWNAEKSGTPNAAFRRAERRGIDPHPALRATFPQGKAFRYAQTDANKKPGFFAEARNFYADLIS